MNSTKEHFWALVRKHYDENRSELSKLIQIDPVEHVRNQLKEAIGIVALTFFELPYEVDPDNVRIENMFAFYVSTNMQIDLRRAVFKCLTSFFCFVCRAWTL